MQIKDASRGLEFTAMAAIDLKATNGEGGFEGYASTMDLDRGGDIVAMGAFDRSLAQHRAKGTKPKMLWNHDPDKVIGVWDEFRQDEKGLYVKGRCIKETALGRDTYELLKAGAIDSMSIGYRTIEAEFDREGDNRKLMEVELWEVSLVTFPMNENARVTGVKRVESIRDAERILRDGGVPGEFAKLIARHGFDEAKARIGGRREGDDDAVKKALANLSASLKQRKTEQNHA
jgi:HK97 family phage prohead protease